MATGSWRVEGVSAGVRRMQKLERAYGADGLNMANDMLQLAGIVRDNIKFEAPEGETGNLKRGVIAKGFARPMRNKPAAMAGMDYRVAPHAHLVERGHITADGGHTAANPFFRRGVNNSRVLVNARLRKMIEDRIKRAAR